MRPHTQLSAYPTDGGTEVMGTMSVRNEGAQARAHTHAPARAHAHARARPRRSPAAVVTALALGLLAGWGGPLDGVRAEFDGGHYAAARQSLSALTRSGQPLRLGDRARFALFSGLTWGALGDTGRAQAWLREARHLRDGSPGSLSAQDEDRLRTALQTYDVAP